LVFEHLITAAAPKGVSTTSPSSNGAAAPAAPVPPSFSRRFCSAVEKGPAEKAVRGAGGAAATLAFGAASADARLAAVLAAWWWHTARGDAHEARGSAHERKATRSAANTLAFGAASAHARLAAVLAAWWPSSVRGAGTRGAGTRVLTSTLSGPAGWRVAGSAWRVRALAPTPVAPDRHAPRGVASLDETPSPLGLAAACMAACSAAAAARLLLAAVLALLRALAALGGCTCTRGGCHDGEAGARGLALAFVAAALQ
jgi:hypothetical protein